jgi:hypothetical protein
VRGIDVLLGDQFDHPQHGSIATTHHYLDFSVVSLLDLSDVPSDSFECALSFLGIEEVYQKYGDDCIWRKIVVQAMVGNGEVVFALAASGFAVDE